MHAEELRTSRRRPLQESELVVHAALLSARGYGEGYGEPGASLSGVTPFTTILKHTHGRFVKSGLLERRVVSVQEHSFYIW